jgi:glyoxylate reductase
MDILYHNRRRDPEAELELPARYRELDALLRESDVVSLNAPLTPETRHLIGARELALMKPTAILVNTARGPLVDEAALADALARGVVWGAGLDVFEREPEIADALTALPNVVLAPHLGSATVTARAGMARLCALAVVAVLKGERVPHLVA